MDLEGHSGVSQPVVLIAFASHLDARASGQNRLSKVSVVEDVR